MWFSQWGGEAAAESFADHCVSLGVDSMLLDALPSGSGMTTALAAGRAAGVPVFEQLDSTGQDWFGQVTKALKKRGIGVFAYLNLIFNANEIEQHPSHAWCHYNNSVACPDGINATCLSAPGHISRYSNLSQQLILQYDVDAVRYDGLMMPIDHHCEGCQAYYRQLYPGEELPTHWEPEQWRRQLDFTRKSYQKAVRTLRNDALAVKKNIMTWFNGFLFDPGTVSPYTTPMQLTDSEDARATENVGFLEFGSPFMQAWTAGVVRPSGGVINGELLHEVKQGPAMDAAMQAMHESVAQGGQAYQYLLFNKTTGMPDDCSSTDFPYYCYNSTSLKLLHSRIAAIEEHIAGTAPTAVVGILHSEQTRLRYGSYDRSSYLSMLQAVFATYRERSVSVLILSSMDLTDPLTLNGLELLVLPETSGLSAAQLVALEKWVRTGGTVLVSGDALRYNATGFENPQGQFAAAEMLGVTYKKTQCWQSPHAWTLSWRGQANRSTVDSNALCVNVIDPAADAETTLTGSVPGVNPGGPFTLVTTRRLEQGRAVYLALKWDNSVGQGWPSTKGQAVLTVPTLVSTMDLLLPEQPLEVSPPNASAAVLLTSQPASGRWVLHFLTPVLVDVQLSSRHVQASEIVQMVPSAGWNVSTSLSVRGLRISVRSIGQALGSFRLLVLKTDDDNVDELTAAYPWLQHCLPFLREMGVQTTGDLRYITDEELQQHCSLNVVQKRRLRAHLRSNIPSLAKTDNRAGDATMEKDLLNLTVRRQHKSRAGRYGWDIVDTLESVNPATTALVIIDMWEKYWCPSDVQSQVALAALINLTATKARERGILIIHAPSDTLPHYNSSAARKWVTMLPRAPIPHLSNNTLPPYPLYPCLDYPHSCWPSCDSYWGNPRTEPLPWSPCDHCAAGQTPAIRIEDTDAIVDSNSLEEFASVVAARRIDTVLYTGVATNMCVMERAWGMINAVKMGLSAVILRELTETAFSPYDSPCTFAPLS